MAGDFAILIPARYESTRFPGKPLVELRGAGGEPRSLIRRSWEAARDVSGACGVWVATDDSRIADAVSAFGGRVVMTSPGCRNGTERCAEASGTLGLDVDIVVNLQGDAPLTPAPVVQALVDALRSDPVAMVATPALRCSPTTYRHLLDDQAAGRVGGTTVVTNARGRALYFSKRVIPHVPAESGERGHQLVFLHLGVYAYRAAALATYATMAPSPLEQAEGLEQLRFLEGDHPIRVVPLEPIGWDCIELNNPEDVPAIEAVLQQRGMD